MTASFVTTRRAAIVIGILALIALPFVIAQDYYINIASLILLYAVFALGIDVLLGYAGMASLGHAGLFGVAGYILANVLTAGYGHAAAIVAALIGGVIATAAYAAVALRSSGISFIMITLALGEIIWGLAYRWISVTNGDNGISVTTRPQPFGLSLASPRAFYDATLVVFLFSIFLVAIFVRSPLGAALAGTRDQPRRMNALGYHVWMTRFLAFLFSGFLSSVSAVLFVYYNQFISPQALALPASAAGLLMVIAGGAGTLLGPVVGAALVVIVQSVVSGLRFTVGSQMDPVDIIKFVLNGLFEHWNFLLGAIFVLIVVFMPEGLVPGIMRLVRVTWHAAFRRRLRPMAPSLGRKP